ncbi:uncharacterized protein LOC143546528 [Bidens hawaiensis]|uniref:uncharacterized protein LOC143546528 n=1 Tax=Bidens hawaiensis TaxID=980011 RepID=UPI004049D891
MTPLLRYLQEGIIPDDKEESRKLKIQALQYEVIDEDLYRRSYLGPYLRCIELKEAEYVIREIHEGICGMQMGAKMVAARAMRAGYYWPAMFLSAVKEIQKRDHCQVHAPVGRKPKTNLIPVAHEQRKPQRLPELQPQQWLEKREPPARRSPESSARRQPEFHVGNWT